MRKPKECKGCGCDRVLTMTVDLWNADTQIGIKTHRICVYCLLKMLRLLKLDWTLDRDVMMACVSELQPFSGGEKTDE